MSKTTIKIDDKVRIIKGPHQQKIGYVSAIMRTLWGDEITDVMVTHYNKNKVPLDDFLVRLSDVKIIGHWTMQ